MVDVISSMLIIIIYFRQDDICEQMINSTTPMKGGCNLTVDDIIVKVKIMMINFN